MSTVTAVTPLGRLALYVEFATVVFRKGDIVKKNGLVTSVDLFPALPEGLESTVDCHFVTIGFTAGLAALSHQEFYELVLQSAPGAFGEDWAQGPSYIQIGAWIGDQTLAFRFMACVQAHGLGKVITPALLHLEGEAADAMAGAGFVMLSGLSAPEGS